MQSALEERCRGILQTDPHRGEGNIKMKQTQSKATNANGTGGWKRPGIDVPIEPLRGCIPGTPGLQSYKRINSQCVNLSQQLHN